MAMSLSATPADTGAVFYPETGLAVVGLTGADATDFLDSQSTIRPSDTGDRVGFGAFADARGRVLLLFRCRRHGLDWQLLIPASEAEWLPAYLSRFVFHARVGIAVERTERVIGIAGPGAPVELECVGISAPAAGRVAVGAGLATLGLADARWLLCGEADRIDALAATLRARLPAGAETAWRVLRLAAGEPEIRAATRGRFLPQMLGLVELGAIDFDKGCYPGQEVIARAQHRGHVKRRMGLFAWSAPLPPAGTSIRIEGQTVEALEGVSLPDERRWLQAVAAWPLNGELAGRLVPPHAG